MRIKSVLDSSVYKTDHVIVILSENRDNNSLKNGFACMVLSEVFELVQFLFVVTFTTFLFNCVEYDVLFANRVVNHTGQTLGPLDRNKVTLPDAILPSEQCTERIQGNSWIIFLLIMAAIFWVYRLVKVICNVLSYWEIRQFYKKALKIQMKNGFACMVLSEVFELVQFLFVVTFTTFLFNCVEYDVLFANRVVNHTGQTLGPLDRNKVTLPDAILPSEQCTERLEMLL
ncbi:autophagy-related 9A-like protein [Labeo rohita]|uniref:Autophagy-related protein 9 n=1 Tax=Labeo rohita TaxID=84645 RepID=A0A498N715_LABRO|nr:autophagy-related 9A-like protein [Labeo rohita]